MLVTSSKKYFVDFRIEVYERDKLIFAHDLDLQGEKSAYKISCRYFRRYFGMVTYAEVFRKKHECDLYCAMAEEMIEIIKPGYPEINFVQSEERFRTVFMLVITWAFSFHVMTGNTSRQISE